MSEMSSRLASLHWTSQLVLSCSGAFLALLVTSFVLIVLWIVVARLSGLDKV